MTVNNVNLEPGFFWIKSRFNGRWEVAEYDGVSWNVDPIYIVGPRIPEPTN